ncbi:ATP-binding protein [Rhizobium paknamense]|uniref:histidine kinase n=1 Tax=Rhizobium paknamense TaxID=1206817 RepID=A0ABU0ILH6_9HYPH|nr:ATP-binding protein [Rhizobium paknamense]MDQ0458240.1 signal transduction histidine kinase [Rhizobium paknamense]
MKELRGASIRTQLLFLAILFVILVSAVAATTEPFIYGRHDKGIEIGLFAGRTEAILTQFAGAHSPLEEDAVIRFAGRLDISVERAAPEDASVAFVAGMSNPQILKQVRELIDDSVATAVVRAFGLRGSETTLIVNLGDGRALAFSTPRFPASIWLWPAFASGLLKIVIPLILLAYIGSWLITGPLVRFASAARRVSMDDHSDVLFKAEGASEITSLAASLNVMQTRIQTMLRERTRILRAISHDLRTPLTRLRMRIERSNEPELRERMLADIGALSSLIDASLEFLDNQYEPHRKIDISSLLQTIADDFADTGVDVRFIGPRRLVYQCMPQGLTRAISNLVDNASRYANHIEIVLEDNNDSVAIRVRDDGPGLSDELKAKVLQPFFKADESRPANLRSGGFGLGLSIAQGIIVTGHKGSFKLLDRHPHGLVAEIILPKSEAGLASS